ncbi:hypothetical protein A5761_06395 [Mycolicibacterium setense]|nr:hypothetical protein QQ25_12855 [Mycolicibacterium setense]OBB20121.1 hypothetical protein A5761_06395 [Mycolicibacterium setense]
MSPYRPINLGNHLNQKTKLSDGQWRKHILYKDISRDLNVILDAESVLEPISTTVSRRYPRSFTATEGLREYSSIRGVIDFAWGAWP